MKRVIAALITAGLLAAVLLFSAGRPDPQTVSSPGARPAAADSPEDCIDRMFKAAEKGDVDAYLGCFTGDQRQQLQRQLADQTNDRFASALIEAVKPLKGRAVFQTSADSDRDESMTKLVVERIYTGRVERQIYQLELESSTWRIAAVHKPQAIQPEIPYGTPVFQPPEAAKDDQSEE